jgi:hypothetical protein
MELYLIFIIFIIVIIVIVLFPVRKIESEPISNPSIIFQSDNEWLLTWKQDVDGQPTITALARDNELPEIFSYTDPVVINGNGRAIVTMRLSHDQELIGNTAIIILDLNGFSIATIAHNISCIDENVLILTQRGPIKAKYITLEDSLLQLDGTYSKILEIRFNFFEGYMYRTPNNTKFTYWHPIKFPGEEKYTVAGKHDMLQTILTSGYVYHFRLEKMTDDILFDNDNVVAESLNSLRHGEEVPRL